MSGFEKQTYTQVPNSLFRVMSDMDECELKVVLYICRHTFGYHRDEIKISTRKLAKAINMSVASVDKGADAAVRRGLVERITDGQNTTLWRALVSDSEIESPESDSESETDVIQKVNRVDSENESQVGVKETIKKTVKKGDLVDGILFFGRQAVEQGEDKVEAVIASLEREFHANFPRTPKMQGIARFILGKERDGQTLVTFAAWARRDEFNASRLYEYAEQPEKIRTRWPQAFTSQSKPLPTVDQMDDWRKGINL